MITTGMPTLDEALGGGFTPGKLHVLAGRTTMGKTALAQRIACAAASSGVRTDIFCLEDARDRFVERALSAATGIPLGSIRHRENVREIEEAGRAISRQLGNRLSMIDSVHHAATTTFIRDQISRDDPPQFVVIDSIRQMEDDRCPPRDFTGDFYAKVAMDLAELAEDLNAAVLLTCWLNSKADGANPWPTLKDLSVSLCPQMTRIPETVLFVHRKDIYDNVRSGHGYVNIVTAKAATLRIGSFTLRWDGHVGTMRDVGMPYREAQARVEDRAVTVADLVADLMRELEEGT